MRDLREKQIEIFVIELDQPSAPMEKMLPLLSADEYERAERFKFEKLRQRFVIGRTNLRKILGRYLAADPASIRFTYTEHGKPYLINTGTKVPPLSFNVSHSEDIAVMALSRGHELGIDVEKIRSISHMDEIAERYFSGRESDTYLAAPKEEKTAAFFDCWTRREALIKAKGLGIFAITDDRNVDEWKLYRFTPKPGFLATLAYPNEDLEIHELSLDPPP